MKYKFLFLLCPFIYCYLIIPLKYIPIYKYNNSNIAEIFNSILNTKLYAEIEIGIPKQNIQLPLDFNTNDFYISDIPLEYFESNSKLNSDLKFYDASKSISLFPLEDIYIDGNNFFLGEYSKDIFYFNDTKFELEFYLPLKLKSAESGGIGLLLNPSSINSDRTFLQRLKKKGLIENYYWSILFNDNNISLIIGKLPHEINHLYGNNSINLNKENIKNLYFEMENGKIKYIINLNKIMIHQNKYLYNFEDIKKIELDYNSGGIKLPNKLIYIFEKLFEEYIISRNCFKGEINIQFFSCKDENGIIDKIRKNFPTLEFQSNDLDFKFNLVLNDLFYKKDNYVYFLLFFDKSDSMDNKKIIMGKPFLKKYQFSFEPNNKLIYFYSQFNTKKDNIIPNDNNNNYIYFLIVLCSFLFVSLIFFLFFKFCLIKLMNRTKKAYELEDEYDYIPHNKNDIINDN